MASKTRRQEATINAILTSIILAEYKFQGVLQEEPSPAFTVELRSRCRRAAKVLAIMGQPIKGGEP